MAQLGKRWNYPSKKKSFGKSWSDEELDQRAKEWLQERVWGKQLIEEERHKHSPIVEL